jgi:hypothetical protein
MSLANTTIIEAADNPALFRRWFRDASTWQAWFVLLAAVFALPLSVAQLAIYTTCTGRTAPPVQPFAEAWLIVGRRGGKSIVLALIAVFLACFRDWTPHLAPGERGTILVMAADRRQARTIMRYIKGMLEGVPPLAAMIERTTADEIELQGRVTIEISTASFRTVRGYTLIGAFCDEAAFWRTEESSNPDVEILDALRPAMATVPGAMLLCASSPYARRGVLYQAHRQHYGKDDSNVLVWKADTRTMNPTVPQSVIDEAYERDPAAAAAEYGGEFRSDIETFVAREVVDAAIVPGRYELPPVSGISYTAFVDPSGGSSDSMTLAIGHRDSDGVAVLDCIREVRAPFSPEDCVTEFAGVLRSYGVGTVRGDRYAGEWPRERFQVHGIAYEPAEMPKGEIYLAFLPMLNSRRCQLLDHPRLTSQLCNLERRTARGGRDSIDHPPGAHDDIGNAGAGVLVGLGAGASGWIDYYRSEVEAAKARLGAKFVQSAADRPLQFGDTAARASLPDAAPSDSIVTFEAPSPFASFFVPAPDGHGRKFVADERALISAPATFRAALERAGCRVTERSTPCFTD